jgi:hypothetical protein
VTLSAPQKAALSAASSAKAPDPRTTTFLPATAGAPSASGDGDLDGGSDEEEALSVLSFSFHSSSCLHALQMTPLKEAVEGSPLSSGAIGLPRVPVATITVEARSLLLSTTTSSSAPSAPPPPVPCARSLSSRSRAAALTSSS